MFRSPTNLHCSQTGATAGLTDKSFVPLRICTALKHYVAFGDITDCFVPLRICTALKLTTNDRYKMDVFRSPTNLHCSQTQSHHITHTFPFRSPTNLHCSQTNGNVIVFLF